MRKMSLCLSCKSRSCLQSEKQISKTRRPMTMPQIKISQDFFFRFSCKWIPPNSLDVKVSFQFAKQCPTIRSTKTCWTPYLFSSVLPSYCCVFSAVSSTNPSYAKLNLQLQSGHLVSIVSLRHIHFQKG